MTTIRPEQPADLEAVRRANREAFGQDDDGRLPADVFMVRVLTPEVAERLHGHVVYQPEFAAVT